MGSEKFVTHAGTGVVTGVARKRVGGVDVYVGNGVMVGISTGTAVGVLAGSEGMGLPLVQAKVKMIVLVKKNKNFTSRIFSRLLKNISW